MQWTVSGPSGENEDYGDTEGLCRFGLSLIKDVSAALGSDPAVVCAGGPVLSCPLFLLLWQQWIIGAQVRWPRLSAWFFVVL